MSVTLLFARIQLAQGDITRLPVAAIINAANSSLFGGGGVDGAINRSGSPAILEECRAIRARQGGCKAGEAVITISGWLPAGYIIHTVGSVWNESHKDKSALLVGCYRNSLRLVE